MPTKVLILWVQFLYYNLLVHLQGVVLSINTKPIFLAKTDNPFLWLKYKNIDNNVLIYYWIISWFNFILGSIFFPFWVGGGGMAKYEETKENEFGTKDKLNHNLYTFASLY